MFEAIATSFQSISARLEPRPNGLVIYRVKMGKMHHPDSFKICCLPNPDQMPPNPDQMAPNPQQMAPNPQQMAPNPGQWFSAFFSFSQCRRHPHAGLSHHRWSKAIRNIWKRISNLELTSICKLHGVSQAHNSILLISWISWTCQPHPGQPDRPLQLLSESCQGFDHLGCRWIWVGNHCNLTFHSWNNWKCWDPGSSQGQTGTNPPSRTLSAR